MTLQHSGTKVETFCSKNTTLTYSFDEIFFETSEDQEHNFGNESYKLDAHYDDWRE